MSLHVIISCKQKVGTTAQWTILRPFRLLIIPISVWRVNICKAASCIYFSTIGADQHNPKYTVRIKCRPLCDCILSIPDVTWHHYMWWDLPTPPTVYAGPLWLCYKSEVLPHERQQCLPRKRRGVENPCTFLIGKSSSKCLQDGTLKLMACIHSFPD